MARFALIGWGWRAEFFARAAAELAPRLELTGVVTRSAERANTVTNNWHVPVYASVDDLLSSPRPDFVVVSVPPAVAVGHLDTLAGANLPALCETPPAPDLEGLAHVCELARRGARIQIAEQYPFQPLHAARLALSDAGVIGNVSMTGVSFSHGYHAFSVLRHHLSVGGEAATIRATSGAAPVEVGNTRAGPRQQIAMTEEVRTLGIIEYPGRLGLYDFETNQHRSYVRFLHVTVRGSHGEISDDELRVVRGLDETMTIPLRRVTAGQDGDLSGHQLMGITGLDGWAWRNPFPGARLADDEIAVAQCLVKMAEHAEGGPEFYGAADGAQDHYLYLKLQQAAGSGDVVRTTVQPWADQMLVNARAEGA